MLDTILDTIKDTGEAVFLSMRTWDRGPWVIAGLANLSKREQLEEWGRRKDLVVTYDPAQNAYHISPTPAFARPELVRQLLPEDQRQRVHPICRLPKGFRLLRPFEKIIPGCRFTRPTSPQWIDCMVGKDHHPYDPKAYFVHCVPSD